MVHPSADPQHLAAQIYQKQILATSRSAGKGSQSTTDVGWYPLVMSYELRQCQHCGKHSKSGKRDCIWCFRPYESATKLQHISIIVILLALAAVAVRLA